MLYLIDFRSYSVTDLIFPDLFRLKESNILCFDTKFKQYQIVFY